MSISFSHYCEYIFLKLIYIYFYFQFIFSNFLSVLRPKKVTCFASIVNIFKKQTCIFNVQGFKFYNKNLKVPPWTSVHFLLSSCFSFMHIVLLLDYFGFNHKRWDIIWYETLNVLKWYNIDIWQLFKT